MDFRRAIWIALLLVATALRLPFPDWDGAIAAHPDERFLLDVAHATPLWGDPCASAPGFPYGHLPVYLARLLVATAPEADPLYAARLLAGLIGVVLVALTGALGYRLVGGWGGLLAAGLLTVAPFPLQQARFYTVDPLATALLSAALLAALRRRWITSGICTGLAVACKISVVWVIVPIAYLLITEVRSSFTAYIPRLAHHVSIFTSHVLCTPSLGRLSLSAFLSFTLASPWSFLRPLTCWQGPLIQAGMAAGRFVFPYTEQYTGTWPYLYPLRQMALWGLGPGVALAGLLGMGLALFRWRQLPTGERALVVWTGIYFGAMGGLYAKFPRYLLLLYPAWTAWAVYAAICMNRSLSRITPVSRFTFYASRFTLLTLLLIPTIALGFAQFSLYTESHPWIEASRWIYENLPPGRTLAVEAWDHPLPVPLPEDDPGAYTQTILPIFEEPSVGKLAKLQRVARETDVVVLASRRGYGALARQPERYAATLAWYEELLETRTMVAFGRCPRLGPLALTDDPLADAGLPQPLTLAARCGTRWALRLPWLDESFRVYDAPVTLLLAR